MASVKQFPTIKEVRTFVIGGVGSGGDYHNVARGHWQVKFQYVWAGLSNFLR